MTSNKKDRYLDVLKQRVIIFDGAMGTGLQQQDLREKHFGGSRYSGCYDYLTISFPDAVEKIHRRFLETGVDVIETNTFRSNRVTLHEFDLSDRAFEINRAAAELAAAVAAEYSTAEHPRFVAGSMGPSGILPSSAESPQGPAAFDTLVDIFAEQAGGLIAGGADILLLETSQDLLEVRAAIEGCRRACREGDIVLPLQVQVTLDTNGRMLLGTDIEAVLTSLGGLPLDILGINCSTGPKHMRTPAEFLCRHSPKPVSTIPNAGMPVNRGGKAYYPLQPEDFADAMEVFVKDLGVDIVGGCCGTTPVHLAALTSRLQGVKPKQRTTSWEDHLASGVSAVTMKQAPPPLIIGERCNPQGSAKFRKLLLEEKYTEASETAREQVEQGAHAIDIATVLSELRNEKERMVRLVQCFTAEGIDVPLVIDSTDPDVMEAALKAAPGRCLLNSTHLEGGEDKAKHVFTLAKRFNAAVMILSIDEEGMAKTVERKTAVARRLYEMAVEEYNLSPGSLVFDLLTFSLATGQSEYIDSALTTLRAVRELKEHLPGIYTSLGISNVSFGFRKPARRVLNSVFLYHAVQAGLDMAILNASDIIPYPDIPSAERRAAEDLIFNTRDEALTRFIELFEDHPDGKSEEKAEEEQKKTAEPGTILREHILKHRKQGLQQHVEALIGSKKGTEAGEEALRAINDILLPAMKEVGDRFGRGETILPFVLQSAEVMKKAVGFLEPYLEKGAGPARGKILLATVAGDVHDIGKNLVKTILSNNGYTVIDLGRQVPAERIVDETEKTHADAVGLSALLVSTSLQMAVTVKELAARNLKVPVLIGGAAVNRAFADEISILHDGSRYAGGVHYCRDAFDGLSILESTGDKEPAVPPAAEPEQERKKKPVAPAPRPPDISSRPVPKAPFLGHRLLEIPLDDVIRHLDTKQLFMLNWGAAKIAADMRPEILTGFEKTLTKLITETRENSYLNLRALYGFFPVLYEDYDLAVLDPDAPLSREVIQRFHFPPDARNGKSAAAGFKKGDEADYDITMFQIVTCGFEAAQRFERLQGMDKYTAAFYFHGFSVQAAEAAAACVFERGIEELGVPADRVRRISWGYPAAPDITEHEKLFRLLPAAEKLDMHLTSAFQLVPEQSTAAIMVYKV